MGMVFQALTCSTYEGCWTTSPLLLKKWGTNKESREKLALELLAKVDREPNHSYPGELSGGQRRSGYCPGAGDAASGDVV